MSKLLIQRTTKPRLRSERVDLGDSCPPNDLNR